MLDIPLVIWVNSPPHVERGAFMYLEEHWSAGVVYAVLGELRAERKLMGWGKDVEMNQTVFRARGSASVEHFCDEIQREYPDAFHLVAGLSSVAGRALSRLVRSSPPERVAVVSERPGVHGPLPLRIAKRLGQPFKYRWLVRRFRNQVGILLPLGSAGIERFLKYGWPIQKAAPFMYCPPAQWQPTTTGSREGAVRFLYVGRLSRYAKGTDILLKAANLLHGNWRLTIVGGHGDLVDEVEEWSASRANVDFAGAASPNEVSRLIGQNDVCIVPSRVDGWNVVVNEAIYAGRGIIVTNAVGSDELISESGAGFVVEAGSARTLAAAMQRVVDDPSLAKTWSERALDYAPLISPDTVGRYLLEVLQAVASQKPGPIRGAPWLRGHGIGEQGGTSE